MQPITVQRQTGQHMCVIKTGHKTDICKMEYLI